MKIQLSEHFTYSKLLRFTLPSIIMLVFSSIYGVVDGFFVSNFVGKTAFTAVNFILPVLMMLGACPCQMGYPSSTVSYWSISSTRFAIPGRALGSSCS